MTSSPTDLTRCRIDAWNRRDLEAALALYAEEAWMSSARIARLGFSPDGRLHGKARLRAYWAKSLEGHTDLHFELLDVAVSPDSIVVRYRTEEGKVVSEYLRLNAAGQIVQGAAHAVCD